MTRKNLFTLALLGMLAAFVIGTLMYFVNVEKEGQAQAQANQSKLLRAHAPTLGKANAQVVIVEFLDPACETCAAFYPHVKQLLALHPERVRLVLRYAPFHKGSDEVVAALEAARKQGKFWPALEALMLAQSDWAIDHTAQVARIWKHLEPLGLDMTQLRADMASPEIGEIIMQDLDDARALKVTKTPDFFVNGKPLPSFGLDQLKKLVNAELDGAP